NLGYAAGAAAGDGAGAQARGNIAAAGAQSLVAGLPALALEGAATDRLGLAAGGAGDGGPGPGAQPGPGPLLGRTRPAGTADRAAPGLRRSARRQALGRPQARGRADTAARRRRPGPAAGDQRRLTTGHRQ